MTAEPGVIDDPDEKRHRLSELGLTAQILRDSIIDGLIARAGCSENDPPTYKNYTLYAVTTRGLRHRLMPKKWHKSDAKNWSHIENPNRTMAIVVSTGTEGTGLTDGEPTTRCPKGPSMFAAVERNQYDLFRQDDPSPMPLNDRTTMFTWVLLVSPTEESVQIELSLPFVIGADGKIEKWWERIPLDPITGADFPDSGRDTDEGPDLDVKVIRRG